MSVKNWLRTIINRVGFDIKRYPLRDSIDYRRIQLINNYGINLVFDVGANVGQYGKRLRQCGYKGRIISFEPLSSAFRVLSRSTSNDPLWECYQLALGDTEGALNINIAKNSISSSFLPMLDRHIKAAPNSVFIGQETVSVKCLDSIANTLISPTDRPMLKMDVQGYEMKVLIGAKNTLHQFYIIETEISLVPLYEGQPSLLDMVKYLEEQSFVLASIHNGFTDEKGHALQVDALFVRC